jgi:hypothetical protein
MTTVTEKGQTYRIRGPYTAQDLRRLFESFQKKYGSTMTFAQWLVQRGKVYFTDRRAR